MSSFIYRIEQRPGYLFLWQAGPPLIPQLILMQTALERALALHGQRKILNDTRDMDPPSDEARDFMIGWFDTPGRLDAVALVMDSPRIKVRTNMDALVNRTPRRGFASIHEAEAWLQRQRRRTK